MPSIGALRITGHEPGGYSLLFNPNRLVEEFRDKGFEVLSVFPHENWTQCGVTARINKK